MFKASEKEIEAIGKLSKRLSDLDLTNGTYNPANLLRWLKSKDLDDEKAESMLRKSIEWRKKTCMDKILEYPIAEDVVKNLPVFLIGQDKEKLPVFYVPVEYWDFKMLSDPNKKDEILKFFLKCHESIVQTCKSYSTKDHIITQGLGVYDYAKASLSPALNKNFKNLIKEVGNNMEAHYPEIIGTRFLINIPKKFYFAFEIFKPFLPSKAVDKFFILDNQPLKWRAALLRRIPATTLPRKYGGICNNQIKNFFTGEMVRIGSDEEENNNDLISFLVEGRDKIELEFNVEKKSSLNWKILIENYDIGFSIFDDESEIYPFKKIDSHQGQIERSFIATKAKYTFLFDNSHSRLRSKTIHYNVNISQL